MTLYVAICLHKKCKESKSRIAYIKLKEHVMQEISVYNFESHINLRGLCVLAFAAKILLKGQLLYS